jgi:hypothetical protein
MQESQPLGHDLRVDKIDAGRIAARPPEAGDKTKLTGSSKTPNTIGIVAVALLAAIEVAMASGVTMTATRRRTKSAISADKPSYCPSSQWYSTVTFWPST